MPAFYPTAAALQNATERRTAYAGGEVCLYKSSLVVTQDTTAAELIAAECDFDGYARIAVANFGVPILAPLSGYAIYSPSFQFTSVPDVTEVTNSVGGLFYLDSADRVRIINPFNPIFSMGAAGQGYIGQLVEYFPTNFAA